MTNAERPPTLTDPIGIGGVIAQDGFDYQVWEGLLRVPAWLRNPAFEAVIFEGLEDIEARFFAPHAPETRLLERLQTKSASLAPKDVQDVFDRFRAFESAYPRKTRVHTLVTPQLPPSLKWIARDADRVRKARPFYAPFAGIQTASDAKLVNDFVQEFGEELGRFAAAGVEVTERPLPSRDAAQAAFGAALAAALPASDVGPRKVKAAFDALEALARRSKGECLTRKDLADALATAIGESVAADDAFRIHVRSDRNGADESALEIDASAFSGGPNGFPSPDRWRAELARPLEATAAWLRSHNVSRIVLSGSYRLTTAFLIGYHFRSACGFEIDIPTREGPWPTDKRSTTPMPHGWIVNEPTELAGDTIVVAVGVLRRPADALRTAGFVDGSLLDAFMPTAMTSSEAAQIGVSVVKGAVAAAAARLRAKRIDLYFAGPAAFAVALGHRWNAMLPTRLFEFDATRDVYLPSANCA